MELKDLRAAVSFFLDNGGGIGEDGNPCPITVKVKNPRSSDNSNKAIISLKNDDETSKYSRYISVQNEIISSL